MLFVIPVRRVSMGLNGNVDEIPLVSFSMLGRVVHQGECGYVGWKEEIRAGRYKISWIPS